MVRPNRPKSGSPQEIHMKVISKVQHTALARPVGYCDHSDFRDSCEPDFSKEQGVHIGRLRGPCSA